MNTTIKFQSDGHINFDDLLFLNVEGPELLAEQLGKEVIYDVDESYIDGIPEPDYEFSEMELIDFTKAKVLRIYDQLCDHKIRLIAAQMKKECDKLRTAAQIKFQEIIDLDESETKN